MVIYQLSIINYQLSIKWYTPGDTNVGLTVTPNTFENNLVNGYRKLRSMPGLLVQTVMEQKEQGVVPIVTMMHLIHRIVYPIKVLPNKLRKGLNFMQTGIEELKISWPIFKPFPIRMLPWNNYGNSMRKP